MGFFKTYSEKQIKKLLPLVNATEALADKFAAMSDAEMRAYTDKLKGDLAAGKTLDDILPEAFALTREAAPGFKHIRTNILSRNANLRGIRINALMTFRIALHEIRLHLVKHLCDDIGAIGIGNGLSGQGMTIKVNAKKMMISFHESVSFPDKNYKSTRRTRL